jgi:deoxyribodipyrimidine photo-lyase
MSKVIHWFRQDLRLRDNPALVQAVKAGNVLPVYILDDENAKEYKMGGASRFWLHHSLKALDISLGGKLAVYVGDPMVILPQIIKRHQVKSVFWNRCYEPWRIARDGQIKEKLLALSVEAKSCNGSLLWEPWDALKKDGTPYRVFTPFYRNGCLSAKAPRSPIPAPSNMALIDDSKYSLAIDDMHLLPSIGWDEQLEPHWQIGENGAQKQLNRFLDEGLINYKDGRNFPAKPYISKLSAYLHFGEISPNQVWHAIRMRGDDKNIDHFCSELGWREFSHSLLYHFPDLPKKNLQSKFDIFPWRDDQPALKRWQQGMTGYPIVDAGMRELWQTGIMHNRVRMIVGSFLVKNLLLHWHHGERWFWDCLVDADLANNSAGWQWIAGCGADAAPYFRVFNPVTQGHKFDQDGEYTKHFVPELKNLPTKYLFSPWEAPQHILDEAGIVLGRDYPKPIVGIKPSRERALAAFSSLKVASL